jgi:hypothetical protein
MYDVMYSHHICGGCKKVYTEPRWISTRNKLIGCPYCKKTEASTSYFCSDNLIEYVPIFIARTYRRLKQWLV